MKRSIFLVIFISFLIPFSAWAAEVEGTFLIPNWSQPVVNGNYNFGDNVIVSGTWQLPPSWGGIIYIYGDGVFDSNDVMQTPGTQMTEIGTGNKYYALPVNTTGVTTSGAWSFNIGPQTAGAHNVYITFWGGTECAINRALNIRTGTNNYTPACDITTENFASNITWHFRNYTVAVPNYASMVLTPDADPALNFLNVELGKQPTQSFIIKNTGGKTLQGTVSGIAAPLSCTGCNYVIAPGATSPITIKYTPTTAPSTLDQTLTFSCKDNTGADCRKILDDYSTSMQPSETRRIIGNAVPNSVPPKAQIDVGATLDYGTIYVGGSGPVAYVDKTITITNNGGGYLVGTIVLSSGEYECRDAVTSTLISCDYNIIAGTSRTIKIRFTPTIVGSHNDTATFTGVASPSVVNLTSQVTNVPILSFNWANSPVVPIKNIAFGSINVGSCSDIGVNLYNIGGGLLTGTVSSIPVRTFADHEDGFSCVNGCSYSNLSHGQWSTMTVRFCPTVAPEVSASAALSNDTSAPYGGTMTMKGSGNTNPLLRVTDAWGNTFSNGSIIPFGNVRLGNISAPGKLIITNTGVGNIHYDANLGVVGDQKYFKCTENCDGDLGASQSKTVSFTFNPTDGGGVRSYAVNNFKIVDDFNFRINLTGNGVKPAFYLHPGGWPDRAPQWCSTGSPDSKCMPPGPKTLDIGQTIFSGDASTGVQNKIFYLYMMNLGLGGSVSYSIPSTAHFVCLGGAYNGHGCVGTLNPYANPTWDYEAMKIEFRPDTPRDYDEPLVITYNNGDGNQTMTLDLKAKSINAGYLSVSPANINLGDIVTNTSLTALFVLKNLGGSPLSGSVIMPTSGAHYESFSCVDGCTYNIDPLAAHTVKVNLLPTVTGAHSITIKFDSDASNGAVNATVSGNGIIAPKISLDTANLTFLDTNLGSSRVLPVTVTNSGIGNLVYSVSPKASDAGITDFYCDANCTNITVGQGGSVETMIRFKPRTGTANLSKSITFTSNGVNIDSPETVAGTKHVLAQGNGVFVPILDPRGADTNFGNVVVSKFKEQTFTIRNVGVEDIPSGYFVITGSSMFTFSCESPDLSGHCLYSLPAGGETMIKIKFNPTALGDRQAIMSLSGMPAAQFVVRGRGVPPNVDYTETHPR